MKKPNVNKAIEDNTQSAKFREMARQLGCDDSESVFRKNLATIGRHRPKPTTTEPKAKN